MSEKGKSYVAQASNAIKHMPKVVMRILKILAFLTLGYWILLIFPPAALAGGNTVLSGVLQAFQTVCATGALILTWLLLGILLLIPK